MRAKQLAVAVFAGTLAIGITPVVAAGQVQTTKTETAGAATSQVTVQRGEVVWVSGNNVMVKNESGELKYYPNVPDTARVTVAGKELGVHDVKPGMKLERTTITTTTPKTIRTVKTVSGVVWNVNPPNQVILTLDNKENQQFTIPKDQKFMVDGKLTDAFGLRKGMRISASAVSESTEDEVTQSVRTTGTAAPAPAPVAAAPVTPPAPTVAVLIIERPRPAPAPAQAAARAPELPKTASLTPLMALVGLASLAAGLGLLWLRLRADAVR